MEVKIKRLESVDTPKAVLWVRTSTKKQEVESQIKDLKKMAQKDGFREEQLIILGGAGLSAIKLKDDYLQEFAKLMATLRDNEQVTHLYTWEVSRLARVETKFYELKGFLLEEGVQLALYAGGYRLFRKTEGGKYEIDRGVEIGLSIFVTMAQQEMQIKKERFDRARRRNKSEGKRNGGRFRLFGYDVVEGKYVANPQEAAILKEVFTMYSQGGFSYDTLSKWLNDHGHKTSAGMGWTPQNVSVMLKKVEYCGDTDSRYPELVSRELFNKVAEVRKANVKGTGKVSKTSGKRTTLASKILKCKDCGSNYVSHGKAYNCFRHAYPKHPTNTGKECENAPQVSMEVIDRLLWNVAKVFDEQRLILQRQFDRDIIKAQVKEMQTVIANKKVQMAQLDDTFNRTNTLFMKGRITEAAYDDRVADIERAKDELNGEISDLNKKVITFTAKDAVLKGVKRGGGELHYTDEDKYNIVHNWISLATVQRVNKSKQLIEITCGFEGIEFGRVSFLVNPHIRSGWTEKVSIITLSVPAELREDIAKELGLPIPEESGKIAAAVMKQYGEVLQGRLDEMMAEIAKGRTPEDILEEWRREDEWNDYVNSQIDEAENWLD